MDNDTLKNVMLATVKSMSSCNTWYWENVQIYPDSISILQLYYTSQEGDQVRMPGVRIRRSTTATESRAVANSRAAPTLIAIKECATYAAGTG